MINIHTEIYGQGQPLVLIHGWSMHSGIWRSFARRLADHYRVICLDFPGHGRSEVVEPYDLPTIGAALLSAIPAQRFHLLGWSLGATVAIDMASRFPERVRSLTVLAGNPCFVQNPHWPGVKEEVLRQFSDNLVVGCQATLLRFLALQVKGLENGKELLKQLKQAMAECEAPREDVLQAGLGLLRDSDLTGRLRQIGCSVRFILGEKDTMVPVRIAEHVRHLKPDADVMIVPSAGHVPFLSHPQLLIDFLVES